LQVTLYDPYLSASEVVFHEEALYQVYLPLPLPGRKKFVRFSVSLQCKSVTDRQTDRQTDKHRTTANKYRAMHSGRAVEITLTSQNYIKLITLIN